MNDEGLTVNAEGGQSDREEAVFHKAGRLRMDWTEDKPDEIVPRDAEKRRLESFFELHLLTSPDEIAGQTGPADIHITDLRLSEAKAATRAAQAPAAGLTATIIRALLNPAWPAVIIPYSGHVEEFGPQWSLLQLYRPAGVHVVWDDINKSRDKDELIKRAAKEYRIALRKGIETGLSDLPLTERDRLYQHALNAPGGTLDGFETVTLATHDGPRRVLLGSLFFDVAEISGAAGYVNACRVKASDVQEWLLTLPALSETVIRAERLSELFWFVAHSQESVECYERLTPPVHKLPWLCDGHWYNEHDHESCAVVRLALLFLLVRETGFRAALSQPDDISDEKQFYRPVVPGGMSVEERIRMQVELYANRYERGVDFWTAEPIPMGDNNVSLLATTLVNSRLADISEFDVMLPLTDRDVVRLIDPLQIPKARQKDDGSVRLITTLTDTALRYGNVLLRAIKDKQGNEQWKLGSRLDVPSLLRVGDISSLSREEIKCVRRFAVAHVPYDLPFGARWIQNVRREANVCH